MSHPRLAPLPDIDFDVDDTDLNEEVLRQNAFDNSEHDYSAVFMDRLDEQLME